MRGGRVFSRHPTSDAMPGCDDDDGSSGSEGPSYECGETPPVRPCNPGRLGGSRTVRDGNAKGVLSPKHEEMLEGDNDGPRVRGMGRHVWCLPNEEESTEGMCTPRRSTPGRSMAVPPIPPCNPERQDVSQTVRDGDAAGGAAGGEQLRQWEVSSPNWESLVAEPDDSGGYLSTEQDDFPANYPAGGRSWASRGYSRGSGPQRSYATGSASR